MSDAFILSQYRYYQRNLLAGPYHSHNLIRGLFEEYAKANAV